MSPDWIFYEWELRLYCPDFSAMLERGLLIRDLEAEKAELCFTRYGQCVHVVRTDESVFGADTENSDEPVAELDPNELIQYRFDTEQWLSTIRLANKLHGAFCRLDGRLFFLGERIEAGRRQGLVVSFFNRADQALSSLFALPSRLPAGFDDIIVSSLLYDGLSLPEIANLERLGILWMPRLASETLIIPDVEKRAGTGTYQPPLGKEIEDESEFYGFKCRVPIHITGKRTRAGSNIVLAGNIEVWMGDSPFALFLRLVMELYRNKWGMVPKIDLQDEGYLRGDGEFQDIHRLRSCFIRSFPELDPKDFIEVHRPKTLRVSVHPALVTYDREKLLVHDNEFIRQLAQQLPEEPQAQRNAALSGCGRNT
jgi:hypothetical protein